MDYLLDTRVFIWWMEKSRRLPQDIYKDINNPHNRIFLSVVTIWELIIKIEAKKIKLKFDLKSSVEKIGFKIIPIQLHHVSEVENLPLHHKDPFDRILIAQAITENLTLITSDQKIWKYRLKLIKA